MLSAEASALTSEEIFEQNKQRLFQIKLIDVDSDSKASLGSGFLIGDAFTVATNYHVISSAVAKPYQFRIVYVLDDGTEGALEIEDFDIVNDLALLKSPVELGEALRIKTVAPRQGATIFALGNPLDLGMTVVPGTYNGLTDHTFYERIHFSGAINSGMSGGPVIDADGDVVGVNVATAGNQIGFLVPASKLEALLRERSSEEARSNVKSNYLKKAAAQLEKSQSRLLDHLFKEEWPIEDLGEAKVIGEIANLVSCWGNSNRNEDVEDPIVQISKGCRLQDSIYISPSMSTGSLEYEFYWFEAPDLADRRFYQFLENNMGGYAGNRAGKEDATEFKCEGAFTQLPEIKDDEVMSKSYLCARRYKKFPQLYDVFYWRLAKRAEHALITHFTLAGVTQESSNRFTQAFLERVTWQ